MVEKPRWIKTGLYSDSEESLVKEILENYNLNSVCREANCPNIGECWKQNTATFMILGDVCTRNCLFCDVRTGNPNMQVDKEEPERLAKAVKKLGLDYVVITSPDRDDLPEGGATQYLRTVEELKKIDMSLLIELLIPDFQGNHRILEEIAHSGSKVIGHNIETVEDITPKVRDKKASYDASLEVLSYLKEINPDILTKSSLILGMGENRDQITAALKDLRRVGVDIVTLGQYMRPSKEQIPVAKYLTPEEFQKLQKEALSMGFKAVKSGSFVRSSYKAKEVYENIVSS